MGGAAHLEGQPQVVDALDGGQGMAWVRHWQLMGGEMAGVMGVWLIGDGGGVALARTRWVRQPARRCSWQSGSVR